MSAKWLSARLGDVIEIKHGFAFKGEHFVDYDTNDVLVTPGNFALGGGFQRNKAKFYNGPIQEDYILSPGDVVVTMTDLSKQADTLGYSARVPANGTRYLHNQRVGKVTIKHPGADLGFAAWVMPTREYRDQVVGSATGSTVKHTSPGRILSYQFEMPPVVEQRRITAVLSALDDKIELNRRMNETLEASARALFRDWFVDFGPTRAKAEGRPAYLAPDLWSLFPNRLGDDGVPEGWTYLPVIKVTSELRRGVSPIYRDAGGIRVLNQKCIRDGMVNVALARRHDEERKAIGGRELMPGDILVNSTGVGTLGRTAQIWQLDETTIVDSHVTVVRSDTTSLSAYILGLNITDRETEIESLSEGSTGQTELSRARLGQLATLVPSKAVQNGFDTRVRPLVEAISQHRLQSHTLATTRDALLPKLMSGEISVRDAEALAA